MNQALTFYCGFEFCRPNNIPNHFIANALRGLLPWLRLALKWPLAFYDGLYEEDILILLHILNLQAKLHNKTLNMQCSLTLLSLASFSVVTYGTHLPSCGWACPPVGGLAHLQVGFGPLLGVVHATWHAGSSHSVPLPPCGWACPPAGGLLPTLGVVCRTLSGLWPT